MAQRIADTFHSVSLGNLVEVPVSPFRVVGYGDGVPLGDIHPDTSELRDILHNAPRKDIITIDSSLSCLEAAKFMLGVRVSSLMIQHPDLPEQIVTDQDFFVHRPLLDGRDVSAISVKEPDTYDARMPIAYALSVMLHYGYRHVPVTFGGDFSERMLSARDLLRYFRNRFNDDPLFDESIGSLLYADKHTDFQSFHVEPSETLDSVSMKAFVTKAGGFLVCEDDGRVPLGVFNGVDNLRTVANGIPGNAPVIDHIGLSGKSLVIRSERAPLGQIADDILEFGTRHVVVQLRNNAHVLVGIKRILSAIVDEKPGDIHNLPHSKEAFMEWAESISPWDGFDPDSLESE